MGSKTYEFNTAEQMNAAVDSILHNLQSSARYGVSRRTDAVSHCTTYKLKNPSQEWGGTLYAQETEGKGILRIEYGHHRVEHAVTHTAHKHGGRMDNREDARNCARWGK